MTGAGPGRSLQGAGAESGPDGWPESLPRYEVVRLPPDDRGHRPWAVLNRSTGGWVHAGGEVDFYVTEDGARACVRRLRYLDEAGIRSTTTAGD